MNSIDPRTLIDQLSSNLIVIGPPLSGKSSFCKEILENWNHIYFSVRGFFEPLRNRIGLNLPKPGVLLPNCIVWQAFKDVIIPQTAYRPFIVDGFPGTKEQAELFKKWIAVSGKSGTVINVEIDEESAMNRTRQRRVCFQCDGGVNPVFLNEYVPQHCPICGDQLGKRPDDTIEGFRHRWEGYRNRCVYILEILKNLKNWNMIEILG